MKFNWPEFFGSLLIFMVCVKYMFPELWDIIQYYMH